jgi:hypothetical protein
VRPLTKSFPRDRKQIRAIANAFKLKVVVQAKHYVPRKGAVPADKLDELIRGMEAEDVDLGMFVTSGYFPRNS